MAALLVEEVVDGAGIADNEFVDGQLVKRGGAAGVGEEKVRALI